MDDLPIDIHSGKLLDWLVSRRHCKKNWQESVEAIREKISNAFIDMSENEQILAFLQMPYINYFYCKEIVEILKETEKDTKNVFGYYSSKLMKDWQEILTLYEKDSVYLAEAAQFLQRFIKYDVPALKKQISKAENGIKDCERKEADHKRQAENACRTYEKELLNYKLKGENFRRELLALTLDLPSFLSTIIESINNLKLAIDYYGKFKIYTSRGAITTTENDLPLLKLIIKQYPDNVTFYEWKYGEIPIKLEKFQFDSDLKEKENDNEIDFGEDEIDFGEDTNNFNIEVIENEDKLKQDKSESKIARGAEAISIIENIETFTRICAELDEIFDFFTFRLFDETEENKIDIYLSGIEQRPKELVVKVAVLKEWIDQIEKIKTSLNDPQKKQLFKICSSPTFVDELVTQFETKRDSEKKNLRLAELMDAKRKEFLTQIFESQKSLDQIIDSIKFLQENIETEISKRYNNREVYIIGEINSVLY